jgi:hypothetical protein
MGYASLVQQIAPIAINCPAIFANLVITIIFRIIPVMELALMVTIQTIKQDNVSPAIQYA